jgi:hypothetical protein
MAIESSDLQADGRRDSVIVLNAVLRNQAQFAQEYPSLELTLTDERDEAVARRVLAPADYLGGAAADVLARGIGPGADAVLRVYIDTAGLRASATACTSSFHDREHALDDAGHRFDRLRHDHGVSGPLPEPPARRPAAHPQRLLPHAEMRREFGGTAGNIAYNLKLLGDDPLLMATVGEDIAPYLDALEASASAPGISSASAASSPRRPSSPPIWTTTRSSPFIPAR